MHVYVIAHMAISKYAPGNVMAIVNTNKKWANTFGLKYSEY